MAKLRVEVCMVSARGLRRPSSLLKPQWFAVGWVDPNSKYCSKIDGSGSSNPTWNTKFSISVDEAELDPRDLVLTLEVYRREPVFLREKLHGTATVALKEFFGKLAEGSPADQRKRGGEVGSFQLRKKKNGRPRGFVDVAVRVLEGTDDGAGHSGSREEVGRWDARSDISLAIDDGPVVAYPSRPRRDPHHTAHTHPHHRGSPAYPPHGHRTPSYPRTHQAAPALADGPYPPAPAEEPRRNGTPPPPPPPSNTGFIPSFFPGIGRPPPESYVGLPNAGRGAAQGGASGFGAGVGAGALAAGAVIFGDDFMSGSDFPAGFGGGSLTVSTDPPF